MERPTFSENTPRSRSSSPVRIIGMLAIAALVIAIILLTLGVIQFGPLGWF